MDVGIGFECESHDRYDNGIVSELVFIATRAVSLDADNRGRPLPRLPELEWLMARARHTVLDTDWRGWLAPRLAPVALTQFGVAAIAGAAFRDAAVPRTDSTGYWLATPIHLFAGLDSLHVHPDGLLLLEPAEQEALAVDFARVFADSAWRLQTLGRRELLLSGPPSAADGADPAGFLGLDPSAGLPRGEGAGALRRLNSEIEMWLHEHALNRARIARGQLPVTALWLWGAQPPHIAQPVADQQRLQSPNLYGEDIYAEALCRLQSIASDDESAGLRAITDARATTSSATVVLVQDVLTLQSRYLSAALQSLRKRQVARLSVIAQGHGFQLSGLDRLCFWRRPRPWWEKLA
jgi:hypothetical protein